MLDAPSRSQHRLARGPRNNPYRLHHGSFFEAEKVHTPSRSVRRIGLYLLLILLGYGLHSWTAPAPSVKSPAVPAETIPAEEEAAPALVASSHHSSHHAPPPDATLADELRPSPSATADPPDSHHVDHETAVKHLVVASWSAQDLTWLQKVPSSWTIKHYLADVPDPKPEDGLAVPLNVGREAMAYLTYIIDHYDDLPDYAVFVHGHATSWHQVGPVWAKIRALNLTSLDRENYVSLRCESQMGCERIPFLDTLNINLGHEKHIRDFWRIILPQQEPPRYLSFKCCAQHAVTRKAMQTRTKQEWTQIREPLFHDLSQFNEHWIENEKDRNWMSTWTVGTYYEKFWHVLLGAGEEYCPSVQQCQQEHFSNAIICDTSADYSVWHGPKWQEAKCITAFDGHDRDAPTQPLLDDFHKRMLDMYRDLQSAARDRYDDAKRLAEQDAAEKKVAAEKAAAEKKAAAAEKKAAAEKEAAEKKAAAENETAKKEAAQKKAGTEKAEKAAAEQAAFEKAASPPQRVPPAPPLPPPAPP